MIMISFLTNPQFARLLSLWDKLKMSNDPFLKSKKCLSKTLNPNKVKATASSSPLTTKRPLKDLNSSFKPKKNSVLENRPLSFRLIAFWIKLSNHHKRMLLRHKRKTLCKLTLGAKPRRMMMTRKIPMPLNSLKPLLTKPFNIFKNHLKIDSAVPIITSNISKTLRNSSNKTTRWWKESLNRIWTPINSPRWLALWPHRSTRVNPNVSNTLRNSRIWFSSECKTFNWQLSRIRSSSVISPSQRNTNTTRMSIFSMRSTTVPIWYTLVPGNTPRMIFHPKRWPFSKIKLYAAIRTWKTLPVLAPLPLWISNTKFSTI